MTSRLEEARRCPSCNFPGELTAKEPRERGSIVYTWTCRNQRCRDVKRGWIMQVLGNNEIPLREGATSGDNRDN